jgi:hypothetical protein
MIKIKLTITTVLLTILTFTSCNKEEVDPRDEMIGSYEISYSCVGTDSYNNGDEEDYSYTFIVSKRGTDELEFDNIESMNIAKLSGNDFVDSYCCYAGSFDGNRIIFTQFEPGSPGFKRDCGTPITAYKR